MKPNAALGFYQKSCRISKPQRDAVYAFRAMRLHMKLRLKPNSVRLRLNQTEVTKFVNVGELAERIEFPGPVPIVLLYGLRVSSDLLSGTAQFENGELTVTIP